MEAANQFNLRQAVSEARGCVTAVVVTFESAATIERCLEPLLQSEEVSLVVVVDNASRDETLTELPDDDSRLRKIRNERNLGFGAACNVGARLSESEFLLFVNPDAQLPALSTQYLLNFLRFRLEAACCGPAIRDEHGLFDPAARRGLPTPLNALGRLFHLEKLFPHNRALSGYTMPWAGFEREMMVDSILGACMMIRREDFMRVGGFDEDYFLFGEDIDLCYRLAKAGREIWYVPSAHMTHIGGASMAKEPRLARREFFRAMEIYWRKHRPRGWSGILSVFVIAGIRLRAMLDRIIGH
ncbi:glycosyltransferase family 2 protein [bacterium]|nr:glycosyltransferase family 2 protein [bacterium]